MNARLRSTALFIAASVLVVAAAFLVANRMLRAAKEAGGAPPASVALEPLAPEVERIISQRIALIEELIRDPAIIAAVQKANEEHESLPLETILQLDARWRNASGIDEFIGAFLTNEVAVKLLEFQEVHPSFAEIFVTDQYGLNVGQTNKTTDYYQADEEWWVGGYRSGQGRSYYGPIEFDESAQAEAISIYVPVMDPQTNTAIGVTKAVLSIASIKLEL